MERPKRCPYDPSSLVNTPFDLFPCPVCGCAVFAGLPHGPCVDPVCHFHSEEAISRMIHPSAYRAPAFPQWR